MSIGNNKLIFVIAGLVFFLIGCAFGIKDINTKTKYEKVESVLTIYYARDNDKKAKVSYEYNGKQYTDKVLSSFNAFTMKDGKKYTIYINPENPEKPHTTSFALDIIFAGMGAFAAYVGLTKKEDDKRFTTLDGKPIDID